MAREKKIIDASVAVKWFVEEQGSDKAMILRDEHISGKITLVAPELIFLEVLNALRYKKIDAETLTKINTALWDTQMHIEKLNQNLLEKSAETALKYNLSLYDAIYLVLANSFGTLLVTADTALAKTPNAILLK